MKKLGVVLLALLLAHGGLWLWGQGWLGGNPGSAQREPARLAAQQHAERFQLLPPQAASEALQPLQCREIGQFADEAALLAAEAALRSQLKLDPAQWQRIERKQPGLWLLATRMADDAEDLERKRQVLERADVKPEKSQAVIGEAQASWIVARFDDETAAQAEQARLRAKGLRALRLIPMRLASSGWWLRLPSLQAGQLKASHPAWPGGLRNCT
jgi:hypothetical protein